MKWIKEYISYILIIAVVLLLRIFIISPVQVDGSSMVPSLNDNDILLLKKYDHSYERFDIVVLKYNNEKLVKRVIGLPGETIVYRNNTLWVNGKKVEEQFLPTNIKTSDFDLSKIGYTEIPKGYYFVVGDNRGDSLDSRFIGLIPKNDIEGTVTFRLFPFSAFGKID